MPPRSEQPYLQGRVVDDHGRPLSGVDVRLTEWSILLRLDVDGSLEVERPQRSVVTGEDGVFAFPESAFRDPVDDDWDDDEWEDEDDEDDEGDRGYDWRDHPWGLVLRCGDGYSIREGLQLFDGPVDVGDVVFRPVSLRRLRVVSDDDTPIDGGLLSVVFYSRPPHEGKHWTLALDGNGAAHVPLFDESVESILMWTLHHPDHPAKHGRVLDWRGPAAEPLVLVSRRGRRVRGRVVDEQGQPVADILVKLTTERMAAADLASLWSVPRTGEDGTFSLTGVDTEGACVLLFDSGVRDVSGDALDAVLNTALALAATHPSGTPLARVPIPADDGAGDVDLGDVRVALPGTDAHAEATCELRLRVVGLDGSPFAAASVFLFSHPVPIGVGATGVPADPDGRAVFASLLPGTYEIHVHVTIDDVDCHYRSEILEPGDDEIDIVVTGAGTARIDLVAEEAPDARTAFRQVHVDEVRGRDVGFETKSDHVTIRSEPGRKDLVVRALGREPVTLRDVEIHADRPTRLRAVLPPAE